eukprot:g1959.t1
MLNSVLTVFAALVQLSRHCSLPQSGATKTALAINYPDRRPSHIFCFVWSPLRGGAEFQLYERVRRELQQICDACLFFTYKKDIDKVLTADEEETYDVLNKVGYRRYYWQEGGLGNRTEVEKKRVTELLEQERERYKRRRMIGDAGMRLPPFVRAAGWRSPPVAVHLRPTTSKTGDPKNRNRAPASSPGDLRDRDADIVELEMDIDKNGLLHSKHQNTKGIFPALEWLFFHRPQELKSEISTPVRMPFFEAVLDKFDYLVTIELDHFLVSKKRIVRAMKTLAVEHEAELLLKNLSSTPTARYNSSSSTTKSNTNSNGTTGAPAPLARLAATSPQPLQFQLGNVLAWNRLAFRCLRAYWRKGELNSGGFGRLVRDEGNPLHHGCPLVAKESPTGKWYWPNCAQDMVFPQFMKEQLEAQCKMALLGFPGCADSRWCAQLPIGLRGKKCMPWEKVVYGGGEIEGDDVGGVGHDFTLTFARIALCLFCATVASANHGLSYQ